MFLTVPVSWACAWSSTSRRWTEWGVFDSSDEDKRDPADRLRRWLWPCESSPPDDSTLPILPIFRTFIIASKSSSRRRVLFSKSSFMKNSLEGRDEVSLWPWASSMQYPCTKCSTILAQAFWKSPRSRVFSSFSWWWSSPSWWWCSSSSWWCSFSSSISLTMSSAEKHYKKHTHTQRNCYIFPKSHSPM